MTDFSQERIIADLHMHSTFSDGCLHPEQMLSMAQREELQCIALTDHDSLDGCNVLLDSGVQNLDLCYVPGVEISTQHGWRDVHMLGYFIDLHAPGLRQMFEANRESREARACMIADNMAEDGYPVSGAAMRSSGKTINRTLLARMLVDAGCATDVDEAFRTLIGRRSKYYVENVKVEAIEAIQLIIEAGGFAFLAHPAQYREIDLIVPFKAEGLHGIEAYHTMHKPDQIEQLLQIASDEDLAVSGGSDWHGDTTHGARLGGSGLDDEGLSAFLRSCGQL